MITARVRVETTEVVRSQENLDTFINKTKKCQLLWDLREEKCPDGFHVAINCVATGHRLNFVTFDFILEYH